MTNGYRVSAISAASPDMSDEAFRELVESVRVQGQLVPIWKSGDEIIDGRKRLRACEELGIAPVVVDVSAGQDPEDVSYALNILRTHYTIGQRAMFASRRATATQADGRARADHKHEGIPSCSKTLAEAAAEVGVHRQAVIEAKRIRRAAAPEVVAAVESGALTLHSAEQIMKAVPKAEQPAIVEKVISSANGSSKQTPARILGTQTTTRRSPVRPLHERMERALDQLETAIEFLSQFVEERQRPSAEWIKRLYAARTQLTRIIKTAERGTA